MNARVLIAALAGAIVSFLLGWLIYGYLVGNFYAAHSLMQYYVGLEKMPPNLIGIFVSGFAYALLIAIIFSSWAKISTIKDGALAGTMISLMVSISVDLSLWSTMNLYGKQVIIVDILIGTVMGAIIGAVIAFILSYKKSA